MVMRNVKRDVQTGPSMGALSGAFGRLDRPAVGGQFTLDRHLPGAGANPDTQRVCWTYFTAATSFTATNLAMHTWSQAAAATPTLCKMGLYAVEENGDLSLLAATANDTSMFASTFTRYERALTEPVPVVAGQRYASAILVVSGVTVPSLLGSPNLGTVAAVAPRVSGALAGQADLPASVSAASVVTSNRIFQTEVLAG